MSERVPRAAASLQRLLSERRDLSSTALSMDGYERWGQGSDPAFEAKVAAQGNISGRITSLTKQFRKRVDALRDSNPDAVQALVAAHQALLQRCIETAEDDSTAAFVAKKELTSWARVGKGTASNVQQNSYYIQYDPALFEALFGFKPGWPIKD